MYTKEMSRDQLIEDNMGLVKNLVRKYSAAVPQKAEDLLQEGYAALIEAVDKFDDQKGIQFSTYASTAIMNAMKRFVINDQSIPVPEYRNNEQLRVADTIARMEASGRTVTPENLAEALGLPLARAQELLTLYIRRQLVSMDNTVDETGDEIGSLMTTGESAEDVVLKDSTSGILLDVIREIFSDRHAEIVAYFYGLGDEDEHTLEQTGQRFGITKERVRQLTGEVTGQHLKSQWQKARFFMFKEKLKKMGI